MVCASGGEGNAAPPVGAEATDPGSVDPSAGFECPALALPGNVSARRDDRRRVESKRRRPLDGANMRFGGRCTAHPRDPDRAANPFFTTSP
jgi:hypothetical protein